MSLTPPEIQIGDEVEIDLDNPECPVCLEECTSPDCHNYYCIHGHQFKWDDEKNGLIRIGNFIRSPTEVRH